MEVQRIEPILLPLVNKFYQANGARARAKSSDRVWVVREQSAIIAALRVVHLCGHEFLTGVHVASSWQGRGVATLMLTEVFKQLYSADVTDNAVNPLLNTTVENKGKQHKPCYTFPYEYLIGFYSKLGWRQIEKQELPLNMQSRYERYCRQGRNIGVMVYHADTPSSML